MRHRFFAGALFAAAASLPSPAAAAQVADEAEVAVRAVVTEFVSAWKEGDVDRLAAVVADSGTVAWVTGSPGEERVASMSFADVLARQRPQAGRYELDQILSLDVVDDRLAVAKVRIHWEKGDYVDYYVLYRTDGVWRIANKTFVTRRSQP